MQVGKVIGRIGFDAIKPFDADKERAFNEFAETVKVPKGKVTEQKIQEFIRLFSENVLGLNQSTERPEEVTAIRSLINEIRDDKENKDTANGNKILSILKFAGRIGLVYFGLPAPF